MRAVWGNCAAARVAEVQFGSAVRTEDRWTEPTVLVRSWSWSLAGDWWSGSWSSWGWLVLNRFGPIKFYPSKHLVWGFISLEILFLLCPNWSKQCLCKCRSPEKAENRWRGSETTNREVILMLLISPMRTSTPPRLFVKTHFSNVTPTVHLAAMSFTCIIM